MARVLIVDDSVVMRQMVQYTLRSAGFEVVEAADADEALRVARAGAFDLVVADVFMPGRTGVELVRDLRAMPRFALTPILLLATGSDAELKEAARRAGATGWIPKPFDPETLLRTARLALASRNTRQFR